MPAPLFFLHIPKTAGTALRAYLADQYHAHATFPASDYGAVDAGLLARLSSYDLVIGHFDTRLLSHLDEGRHVGALLLREPVSRTVSALRHAIADPNFRPPGVAMAGRTLSEVIRDPEVMARFSNNQTGLLSAGKKGSIAEQALPFTFDAIEADLALALANLDRFDLVGVAEDVEASMLRLAWHCGLYPVKAVPRLNVAPRQPEQALTGVEGRILAACNTLDSALYAAALTRPRPPVPDRLALIASLPDAYFPPLDGSDILSRLPFCGYGFYRPDDIGAGRSGRWTGPGTVAGVTFRLPDSGTCVFYIDYFFLADHASSVTFLVDGKPAAAEVCKVRGACFAKITHTLTGAGKRDVELELRTDRVAASPQDVRPRGLVVSGLRAIVLA